MSSISKTRLSFSSTPSSSKTDTARTLAALDTTLVVPALGSWSKAVTVTTQVVADSEVRNAIVYTAGETVSYERLAEIVEGLVGKTVKREVCTGEKLKGEL